VNAGVIGSVREVGTPEGSIVEVADLFYNLPARRKFLKADAAESAQISRLVTQLALGYPEVGFTLTSAGRRVLQAPPVRDIRERFFQLYGERGELVEVRRETTGLQIIGFVAPLGDQGPVRGPQNIFVNRRIVRDKTIAHAITAAYSVATIKERSPEVHLFIKLPADRVDVNVHPTKAEVRFLEQSFVHEVIRRALGDALGTSQTPVLQFQLQSPAAPPMSEAAPTAGTLPGVWSGLAGVHRGDAPPGHQAWRAATDTDAEVAVMAGPAASQLPSEALARQSIVDAVRPMSLLGQFRNTYILAVDTEGICIIDQHVAHERVLFEEVMERLTSGVLPSQRLLHPLIIDAAPAQREALTAHAPDLSRLGFEIEDFGGGSIRVAAVPAILGVDAAEAAVRALGEDLEGFDRGSRVEDALRRIAATTACHAAVKANQPLAPEKMVHILAELRRTAYSTVCPHGRPVVLRLTRREIEKNFQRI
jgi:DNA mismatch repair protein MutL